MSDERQLSLVGSVSLGTGVMVGAGIFALVGQVAELAGPRVPEAFLLGAVVTAFAAYAYARYSAANPTSGGIAMLLKAAYGPGFVAGSFSLFMYVSMVIAQSLLARTFGTYLLQPWGLQDSAVLVPALGVSLIAVAAVINVKGIGFVEGSAATSAAIKVVGLAVLAVAGLAAAGWSSVATALLPAAGTDDGTGAGWFGLAAATTLCVLAYKGFTTITNQGDDLRDAERQLPRSILWSIVACAVVYLLLTVAVTAALTPAEIADARDYAIAAAAEPLLGVWGVRLTIGLAVVATFSGLLASIYAVSRLYSMLHSMGQVPLLPVSVHRQPVLLTAGLAMLTTVFFDLTQMASMGAILYLTMDVAVQWGVLRRLAADIGAKRWIPAVAIVLDVVVLAAFVVLKLQREPATIVAGVGVAVVVLASQALVVRRRRAHEDEGGAAGHGA
ncbi:APC family permease [Cellulomonas sp. APG4]|uniref:APC family permease n=1 Tax=Cellulomonas sp. APG4 TaxID=1538656 RepID=UPI001379CFCB|nr:APC family permease [Cellulomonas sp. APG4]NCT90564.1 APC family permease [Cellulomonas sp. APG4]